MRVIIIREDGVVGLDGKFRKVDLTGFPAEIHAIQWSGNAGYVELNDGTNEPLTDISAYQIFIDRWTAAAPIVVPPTPSERKAAAHARINAAYVATIAALTRGYPDTEIASWPKQETEARAWMADNSVSTPWLDSAATARGISKLDLVTRVIQQADALAPLHGALSGKRQSLRDQIDALGGSPTQEQLDSIQW